MRALSPFALISLCLSAQGPSQVPEQVHLDRLARSPGPKVVLLEALPKGERQAWQRLILSEGLFEADLQLFEGTEAPFQAWMRSRHGLGPARWVVLDAQHRPLASGQAPPREANLAAQLSGAGFQSPLRQLRAFVKAHPDHLEARADLLIQLRRRAVRAAQAGKGALGPEADTIAWAPFADAVNATFHGDWRGIQLPFFRVHEDQPEASSPMMKALFTRHIAKVEAALQDEPHSERLWQIWAWMARSLGDRPWKAFLASLDPCRIEGATPCPAADVSAWLTREAKAQGDWTTVADLARQALGFEGYGQIFTSAWVPGGMTLRSDHSALEGYPDRSATAPLVEALLRLKRPDQARDVVEPLRHRKNGPARVAALAPLARQLGYPDLAAEWSGERPVPFSFGSSTQPTLLISDASGSLDAEAVKDILPLLSPLDVRVSSYPPEGNQVLGWTDAKPRWALIDLKGKAALQGEGRPSEDDLKRGLAAMGYRSPLEQARERLASHPGDPMAGYALAMGIGLKRTGSKEGPELDADRDAILWAESLKAWEAFYGHEQAWKVPHKSPVMATMDFYVLARWNAPFRQSPSLKALAAKVLSKLEGALTQQPGSEWLWTQWIFWRAIEGQQRPIARLVDGLVPGPMQAPGTLPPSIVQETWLEEAERTGQWAQAVKLLRAPWERALSALDTPDGKSKAPTPDAATWRVAQRLMQALLQDGRAKEADDVLQAFRTRGGTPTKMESLVELARKTGQEGLASEWSRLKG